MPAFRLKKAEEIRDKTTESMLKQIRRMYYELYSDISKRISQGGNSLSNQNLMLIQRQIRNRVEQINEELDGNVRANMETVCEAVTEDIRTYLKQMGFRAEDITQAYMHIPAQVIESIVTGQIYQEGWSLSQAIWGYNQRTQQVLQNIITMGAGEGKSAYDIAKDLEAYVDPSAKKTAQTIRSWRYATEADVRAGRASAVGERITDYFHPGKVDYNALLLARTMVSHAYQQTFERVNKYDPFVIGYRWLTSNFHERVCPICIERATNDSYGLGAGVFPKDELPLDHPNGMCTFEAVMSDSMTEIARRIGEWYNSPVGTFPDIDRYAQDFVV